ncbi:hypothetical protein [Hyalangium rubrum]|uniref:Uncharacterized protein n=1 Tax=Hyalangium rubrum TaxID=3103134 RepID=A0ABU5HC65_9BACT|nr:hypothetical protein [Hyalangium sp. s54d21]MDY7231048.1 hypothetical protein [Hyalangium sp. s54d21]
MIPPVSARILAQLLLFLLASQALAQSAPSAQSHVVDPQTGLSLGFQVKAGITCVVVPENLYDPEACEGIPSRGSSTAPSVEKSLQALAVLRQGEAMVMLTASSISRPGIGQMREQQLRGFIEATMARLAEDFGTAPRLAGGEDAPYTLQRIGEIPVARWEYSTELKAGDPQENVASGVAYLVPSRDSLTIISFNTHKQYLAVARDFGEQVMSTLKLPLTVDAAGFGASSVLDASPVAITALVASSLIFVLLGGVWLWWRRGRG